jgi:tRNA(fMet)-specific endonuclease VapC
LKYVLDTNTLSFLMQGEERVVRRLTARRRSDVLLPQPVVAEIAYGLARLPQSARRDRLRRRFQAFLGELARADWTDAVSFAFGEVKARLEQDGVRLEDLDVAVAAHSLALDATLVTDNLRHMARVPGLRLENWREPEETNNSAVRGRKS